MTKNTRLSNGNLVRFRPVSAIIIMNKKREEKIMLCKKKSCDKKCDLKTKLGYMLLGVAVGSAGVAGFCLKCKLIKKKNGFMSSLCDCGCMDTLKLKKHSNGHSESNNTYENFCECDCEPDNTCGPYDTEGARNGYYGHSDSEKCDMDELHSHGCLGYPHDEYCGFASSHNDRPNDQSSPEIENQKGIPEGNMTPLSVKNKAQKFNPQPENAVTDAHAKKKK